MTSSSVAPSSKTAKKVVDGIGEFNSFYEPLKSYISFKKEEVLHVGDKFKDKKFVFSKFRDEALKQKIVSLGGTVSDSVSSKTYAVITKDKSDKSTKIEKAKAGGVIVMTREEFESQL